MIYIQLHLCSCATFVQAVHPLTHSIHCTQFEFASSHYSKYNNETLHSYTNSSLVCVNIDLRHVCNQGINHNLLLTTATTAVCLSVPVVGMCVCVCVCVCVR